MTYQPYPITQFRTGTDYEVQPWILPADAFQVILNGWLMNGILSKRSGMQFFGQMVYDSDPNPTNPIMGIKSFVDTNNVLQLLIFDTKRAAIYNTGTESFDPLDTADIFDGTPSSFISAVGYGKTNSFGTSTFFFTNFNGDTTLPISPMRLFNTGTTTFLFIPNTRPTVDNNLVIAAQFIFTIKSRVLLLNTVESLIAPVGTPPVGTGTNYAQRMRWCRANNPTTAFSQAPPDNTWDEITPGNGGFVDCPTSDQMVSAKQLQDVIIVLFTNSMWAIEPTADPALPFRWTKINSYRACDAGYATISHDRFIIPFGKRGITACDRVEVQRLDQKIENFMMDQVNATFYERMYSERNYTNKRSFTLFPSSVENLNPEEQAETSNYALIRSDEEGAWSIYSVFTKDLDPDNGTNLSCLGYAEVTQDLAFNDFTGIRDFSFEDFDDETWQSFFFQDNTEVFLAGDQAGRILFLESGGDDMGEDIPFELLSAGWNPFKEQGTQAQLGYIDFYVDADQDTEFTVEFFADDIDEPYASQTMNCLPNLGYIADIVNITLANPVSINAPGNGLITGDQVFIYQLSGADEVSGGPYTITTVDDDNFTLDGIDGTAFTAYIGGGQVVERAFQNTKCMKRAFAGGKGYQHFIKITNNGKNDVLIFSGFIPWFRQAGRRIIGG